MKKLDAKKIIIIIVAVLVIIGIIALVIKNSNKQEKANEEETTKIEEITTNYIKSLKLGNTNQYLGANLLFTDNKITYDDLSTADILGTAFRYVTSDENYVLDTDLNLSLLSSGYDINDYVAIVSGENVRNAIKTLFGKDWDNKEYINYGTGSYYNYTYNENLDCYFQSFNDNYDLIDFQNIKSIYTKTISTTKNKNEAKIKIAVAYVENLENAKVFYSDEDNKEELYKSEEDEDTIREDYIDKLSTYTITYKIDGDNYYFDSIEKN